ncbi:hypothetical protein Bbelb_283800 [Branchiostoma belcheri]|nr:hypothetical protein Bbelb_283800 [Branchiostoma belcheri]
MHTLPVGSTIPITSAGASSPRQCTCQCLAGDVYHCRLLINSYPIGSRFGASRVTLPQQQPVRRYCKRHPQVNDDVSDINKHPENICAKLTFVKHPQLWDNSDHNNRLFENDGYHLNGLGRREEPRLHSRLSSVVQHHPKGSEDGQRDRSRCLHTQSEKHLPLLRHTCF